MLAFFHCRHAMHLSEEKHYATMLQKATRETNGPLGCLQTTGNKSKLKIGATSKYPATAASR